MKLLVIDDNKKLAYEIKEFFRDIYLIDTAFSGEDGLYESSQHTYDLIIVDLGLPDISGKDVCKQLRKNNYTRPILILTGSLDLDGPVHLLDSGADDYVHKPCSLSELGARIRALLRRGSSGLASSLLITGDLIVDVATRQVVRNGEFIQLRRKEYCVLEYMLRNVGRVLTREMIISQVWGEEHEIDSNIIDVHINALRDKIDKPYDKKYIQTIHGIGYRLTK